MCVKDKIESGFPISLNIIIRWGKSNNIRNGFCSSPLDSEVQDGIGLDIYNLLESINETTLNTLVERHNIEKSI